MLPILFSGRYYVLQKMGMIYTRAGSMNVTRYSTLLRHSICVKLHRIMSPIGKCHAIITRKQEIGLNLQFSELSQPPPPAFYINFLFISGICPSISRDRRTREQFRVADRQSTQGSDMQRRNGHCRPVPLSPQLIFAHQAPGTRDTID